MLAVSNIRKSYGEVVALNDVSLEVRAGEICALVGPNGAGKTTLVSIVTGLRSADSGEVIVNGIDAIRQGLLARRHIGLAPQELGIYPSLTVEENLRFFGELADLHSRRLAQRVDEVASIFQLEPLMKRRAQRLSGGEKRRVHTAAAILHEPELLLLDEPTSGVDVQTRRALLTAIRAMAEDRGTAICYSTHYLHEIEELNASLAIIAGGRIVGRGAVDDFLRQHGESQIELTFAGSPPSLSSRWRTTSGDRSLRVFTDQPHQDLAKVLGEIDPLSTQLQQVALLAPSLEAVFLAVTGRALDDDEPLESSLPRVESADAGAGR